MGPNISYGASKKEEMRAVIIALIFGAAIAVWIMFAVGESSDKAVSERFTASESKKHTLSADIMDAYKDLYKRYPQTEVLVHYRDSALEGGLTLEEVKLRIKSDGGTPPGLKVADPEAESDIAALAEKNAGTAPPKRGDVPYNPNDAKKQVHPDSSEPGIRPPMPLNVQGLPHKLMSLATQLSAIAEEIKASDASVSRPGPKGIESFIAF